MKSRKMYSLIIAAIMLLSVVCIKADAASVFKRQKKSIYLVMDDSGSMGGQPTHDANYSLQTLIAMTDKNDSVNIRFLNDNGSKIGKIDMLSKSNTLIEHIKNNYPAGTGGTPYQPVQVAQQEIKSAASKNDETDYWLVVFTDGQFGMDVNSDLRTFATQLLANGTYPNVLFLSTAPNNVSGDGIPNMHSISGNSVLEVMNEAASIISSRIEVNNPSYSHNNSNVTFNLPYPAKNIVVFTQNNKVTITGSSAQSSLDTSENYTVSYPYKSTLTDSTVCFIVESNGSSIASGDVQLTFDKPLNTQDTTILFEPAIGITAHFYNEDGEEITPRDFTVNSKIKVKYNLCDSETNQDLPDSIFNGNVTYSSTINGQPYTTNEFEFEITSDAVDMNLSATLPDGYVLETLINQENLPKQRLITFMLSNGGNFHSDYSKLKEAEPVEAKILINGSAPTPKELKDFSIHVKGENLIISNFAIEKDTNSGSFKIKPRAGWISPLTPKQKSYEVVLKDKDGTTYTATMNVEIPGKRSWLPFILMLLALYIVFCVLLPKKYFRWNATFTVWARTLPPTNNIPCFQRRSIWKLYWDEFVALVTFKSASGLIHFLEFFFVPFSCQKVTLHSISNGHFSMVTLHATEGLFIRNGGNLMLNDKTMRYENNKHISKYGIIRADRMTPVDFNNLVLNGLIPYDDGESLYTIINSQKWFITYKK